MKKNKILSILITLLLFVLSCEKNEDPYGTRGAGIVPVISGINPAFFLAADVENSYVEFSVSLSDGDVAKSGIVVASLNGQAEMKEVATISSFPNTVRITGGEVATALGISADDITGGDIINLEVLTTSESGVTTRSTAVVNASVACEYDPDLASGIYNAYSDEDNWAIDGDITLEVDPVDNTTIYVTGLSELDGLTEDGGPLVMHINLSNFQVTVDHTVLASVGWYDYTNAAYEGTGTYSSCDGTFKLDLTLTVDEGSFGTYAFTFTKK